MSQRTGGLPPLNPPRKNRKRGFALMDPERLREISRMGGAAVPAHLRSFAQDRALAAKAGVKGGRATSLARWATQPALPRAEADRLRRLAKLEPDR